MNTAKTEAYNINANFFRCSLDDFHKYKMSMGLNNGKKPVAIAQL